MVKCCHVKIDSFKLKLFYGLQKFKLTKSTILLAVNPTFKKRLK